MGTNVTMKIIVLFGLAILHSCNKCSFCLQLTPLTPTIFVKIITIIWIARAKLEINIASHAQNLQCVQNTASVVFIPGKDWAQGLITKKKRSLMRLRKNKFYLLKPKYFASHSNQSDDGHLNVRPNIYFWIDIKICFSLIFNKNV